MSESLGSVAIIPARGGSKGVQGKNVARVGGTPLVARAVRTALAAGVDAVYVSTDDDAIAAASRDAGAGVIERPAEIASDVATSEAAVLHALDVLDARGERYRTIAFMQATSPFIRPQDLAAAVDIVERREADVVFSAFETYAFLWRQQEGGAAEGVNHDHSFRPRRQDREPHYQETGAFYVMDAEGFRAAGFRFFGRVQLQEVEEAWALEIDSAEQLEMARRQAPFFLNESSEEAISSAIAVVTDFDGVHTDDTASVDQEGVESVIVSRSDGMGVELLLKAGVRFLILSKERNPVVAARARKLGVEVLQGVDDKATALTEWASSAGIDLTATVYVGNDVNDIGCLDLVGWPVVVADAHPDVVSHARVVLERSGGHGAIRELSDRLLQDRR
jgi:YrbI family 3-deoxy-D-manno-octulosonate 8-phosphate phosphatase